MSSYLVRVSLHFVEKYATMDSMSTLVSPDIPDSSLRLKNYYKVAGVYGAIWIMFHLISVFFFGFIV